MDLDPQNFATLCLGLDIQSVRCSLADVLLEDRPMQEAVVLNQCSRLVDCAG